MRIATIVLTVGVFISVVAAAIAVGIVAGRASQKKVVVVRADISVALDRLIASFELEQYFNTPETLQDLINSLNEKIKAEFPSTYVKVIISAFSRRPILISELSARQLTDTTGRPSLVIVNGSVFFVQDYLKEQIQSALKDYVRTITLVNINGGPSPALAPISLRYSVFTDTYATNLTVDQVNQLVSLDISSNSSFGNATKQNSTLFFTSGRRLTRSLPATDVGPEHVFPMQLSNVDDECRMRFRMDMKLTVTRSIGTHEQAVFFDRTDHARHFGMDLYEQFRHSFPRAALKLIVSNVSDQPMLLDTDKWSQDQLSVITIESALYSSVNYTRENVRNAIRHFKPTVNLIDRDEQLSSGSGTLDVEYSQFNHTDLVPPNDAVECLVEQNYHHSG